MDFYGLYGFLRVFYGFPRFFVALSGVFVPKSCSLEGRGVDSKEFLLHLQGDLGTLRLAAQET